MNKLRRKQLEDLSARIDVIKEELEIIRNEEQEYYDNMPDSIQEGEKGQIADGAIQSMDEAISELESAAESIGGAISQ